MAGAEVEPEPVPRADQHALVANPAIGQGPAVVRAAVIGDVNNRGRELFVAGLATFYTVFLVFAAGLDFALLSFIIYAPGTVLFVMTRREQGRRTFSRAELIILVVAVAGAVAGIACLATGVITI